MASILRYRYVRIHILLVVYSDIIELYGRANGTPRYRYGTGTYRYSSIYYKFLSN